MTETTATDPILRTLIATHALLAEGPERWTRGAFARDKSGRDYCDPDATICWCLAGALFKVVPDSAAAERAIMRLTGIKNIRAFNDDPATTYADVLAVLARSIDARREEIGGGA